MEDFPAAHSMDTEWFAVDRDGCVAQFHSRDGGAVPKAVRSPRNERDPGLTETWCPERAGLGGVAPALAREELDRFLAEDRGGDGPRILLPHDKRSFARCLSILRRDAACRPSTVPLRDGDALYLWRRPSRMGRLLLRLRGNAVWRSLPPELDFWEGWLWACGFIHYVSDSDQDNDVYGRRPLLPGSMTLAHLPPDVAARVGVVRFDFSFREKEILQPCMHVPCIGWTHDRWFDEGGIFRDSGLEDAWKRRERP